MIYSNARSKYGSIYTNTNLYNGKYIAGDSIHYQAAHLYTEDEKCIALNK